MSFFSRTSKCLKKHYFAIFCLVLDCIIYVSFISVYWDIHEEMIFDDLFTEFWSDELLGRTEEEVESSYGSHIAEELQGDEIRKGAIWWPCWHTTTKMGELQAGQIAKFRLHRGPAKPVYVWYVEDTNRVWRVVRSIVPPYGMFEGFYEPAGD